MNFKNVGLIVKQNTEVIEAIASQIISILKDKNCTLYCDASTETFTKSESNNNTAPKQMGEVCDLIIVIGGDGTFLNAASSLAHADVPLVGINVGRLGFLVDISPDDIDKSLTQILEGNYNTEERFLLSAEVLRDNKSLFSADAFNDVVIHIRDVARIMEYETRINNVFVNHQRADGLIIATPTGSTAYALSSGGPLLHPTLNAITLVPISPHTLSNRPIVVNSDSEIDVLICETKHANANVTCDGRTAFDLMEGDIIKVKRQSHLVTLLHPPGYDHYHTLREKLHWSEHP